MTYKGKKVESSEDRTEDYRNWRHTFGNGQYVIDIDQIEHRYIDGGPVPVAVLELTRADYLPNSWESLYDAVLNRIDVKGSQGEILRLVANALNVEAYIVLFSRNLSDFHLYNLTQNRGWARFNHRQYREFITSLHGRVK